jgi:hypothetical protein
MTEFYMFSVPTQAATDSAVGVFFSVIRNIVVYREA